MVNPIKNRSQNSVRPPAKKKAPKEVDVRVKKAMKKVKLPTFAKTGRLANVSKKNASEQAYLLAERTTALARSKVFASRKAAVEAQKKAFLAQRAQSAQQAAALRRARAAERARKAAERAARKAALSREGVKFKAYLAKNGDKKRNGLLKKFLSGAPKKKKND